MFKDEAQRQLSNISNLDARDITNENTYEKTLKGFFKNDSLVIKSFLGYEK